MGQFTLLLLVTFLSIGILIGRLPSFYSQVREDRFAINSWKKGSRTIRPREFEVVLDKNNREYKTILDSEKNNDKFELIIKHNPASPSGPYFESWNVLLFDNSSLIIDIEKEKGLRKNLLLGEQPDFTPGKHYFLKEDKIGYLYPIEQPNYRLHGVLAYPFLAKRTIKVESFYCTIQVINYEKSVINPREIDQLTVRITFSNKID